jgi:hypothetical protein
MENIIGVPQKIKNNTVIRSHIHTTGYVPKGNEISMVKRNIYSQVQCFHSNQEIEINPVSING